MIYRSKVDFWLAGLGLAGAAVLVGGGLIPVLRQHAWGHAAVLVGIMGAVAILSYPLHYYVSDRELVVRSGIQRWRIPLANIVGVQPRLNFIASPALSLDRLEIEYEENGTAQSILISPKNQDDFLYDLATRVRGLRPFGFGLARRAWYGPAPVTRNSTATSPIFARQIGHPRMDGLRRS
jgi:Bacterial PH domain